MTEDGKNKPGSDPREIPIEGADGGKGQEAAASAAAGSPAAEACGPEVSETSFVDELESEVQDGAEGAAEAPVEGAPRMDETAVAKAEAAAMRDKYLRLQADWDNFRKRTAEENDQLRKRATEKLAEDVLPVLDDFERAVAHAEQNGETGLLEGVKAISAKLRMVLGKHGLEAIDPVGEAFDALQHQAVATVEDASVPDETVAQVYQKGYRMGAKVIRPAMVTISTGGPKREPAPDESE